jgi:ankyrin repeat protein
MDNLMLRFPHLFQQTFQKLNNESLLKSREIARSWKYFINERNYPWLCVVNIPKLLQKSNTYLHLAAETGQIDAFKTAFSEEEDKNLKIIDGQTAFHLACFNDRFNIAELLLENSFKSGIDVNAKCKRIKTGLMLACKNGHLKIVKILMEYSLDTLSIDFNTKDDLGNTAFGHACRNGHLDLVKLFMENSTILSINLNGRNNAGQTAFHLASKCNHVNVVKMFMDNSETLCHVNAKDNDGRTAFHLACGRGHVNVAKMFVEKSAPLIIDLNAKDKEFRTAFHMANFNVAKMVLENSSTSTRVRLLFSCPPLVYKLTNKQNF